MGCQLCPTRPPDVKPIVDKPIKPNPQKKHPKPKTDTVDSDNPSPESSIKSDQEDIPTIDEDDDDTVSEPLAIVDELVDIEVADPEAFNHVFIQQRQQAIDNRSYRSIIESWQPNSLQELTQSIDGLSKGKSTIDRHWIIFYWITINIEYDTVSYFSKDYKEQSANGVFRTKKGVCAGYGNLYKYLCDQLEMTCEIVKGYSKGYGFDDHESAPTEIDHAWNAVEIYHHWYLMESTWGAGQLDDSKQFKRELTTYYFLPRPNEMIYHHLPTNEKWQLLRTPIKMKQYIHMPKLRPEYFEFNLETIQPRNQCFVDLEKNEPFALVIMTAPTGVRLTTDLKLHDQKIDGGHDVVFDKRQRFYYCYFAPVNIGKHKITIYAKRGDTNLGTFNSVLDLTLNIKQMPKNPISYPEKWKCFYDFGLKVVSPLRTHLINLNNGEKFAQISIRTPTDIELTGALKNHEKERVPYGDQVYYDRQKDSWRCQFAPNTNGIFDALILARKKADPGNYTSAVSFKIKANQIPSPPYSFPATTQIFHDFGLQILSPVGRGIIELNDKISFLEIRIKAPNDVALDGELRNKKNEEINQGGETYYDKKKDFWRCRFAPNRNGTFDALIFAKKKSNSGEFTTAVTFKIKVKQLSAQPIALPNTTQFFYDYELKVLSPLGCNKINLPEQSSFAEICLKTPNDIELVGQLVNSNHELIPDAEQVYYDRHKDIWRCQFAPNRNGLFDARIMAKKNSDSDLYNSVITFQIEANHIHSIPFTFPRTEQSFYDFDLKIETPQNRSTAKWSENASYAEVLIQAPDDVQLVCDIKYNNIEIENGSLAQFDNDKKLWQLLFAPQQTGLHELVIFAKYYNNKDARPTLVVVFPLNVTKLKQPMKFPLIFGSFKTTKCRLYTPLNGTLKKGSLVSIHCFIPGATSVTLTIDSKTARTEGYVDPFLQRQITVGSDEVTICAKYGQNPHYTSLIKYAVE